MFRDFIGLGENETADIQIFTANNAGQAWNRPRGKSMMYAIAIGAGSGGGAGFTGATATVRGGGGGGGSGAIARCIMPIIFCPNVLYPIVGRGGNGGATSGANGSAGERTYISIFPASTASSNIFLQSGANAATGGTGGSVAGSAAAGAAETISAQSLCVWAQTGVLSFNAGKIGAIGGVVGGGNGASNTLFTTHALNGGAGGGTTPAANTEFTGGNQTTPGNPWRTANGGAGAGGQGDGGFVFNFPWGSYGGCGGGTGGAGQAGAGSNGGIGSGGGGGGGGITFGRGGRGGDGMVIIISW